MLIPSAFTFASSIFQGTASERHVCLIIATFASVPFSLAGTTFAFAPNSWDGAIASAGAVPGRYVAVIRVELVCGPVDEITG